MNYRKLGLTDIHVSVLALGCWAFAGDSNWGPQDDSASIATVHAALDAGINLFDTAEAYGAGRSEEVLGRALAGRRQQAVIATKASGDHLAPADLAKACERSLKALGTDYIDLYQLHWPSRSIPLADSLGGLNRLREQGKVRAFGVCNFGVLDMADLWAVQRVETNQLPYSLVWRAIEYGIQDECVRKDVGIVCYQPLMQGLLAGKFASADEVPAGRARTRHFAGTRPGTRHGEPGCEAQTFAALAQVRQISAQLGLPMALVSLAWLLHRPGVTSILAGARTPEQVGENARAADLELSPGVVRALAGATDDLKQGLGPNPDPYQGSADSRFR